MISRKLANCFLLTVLDSALTPSIFANLLWQTEEYIIKKRPWRVTRSSKMHLDIIIYNIHSPNDDFVYSVYTTWCSIISLASTKNTQQTQHKKAYDLRGGYNMIHQTIWSKPPIPSYPSWSACSSRRVPTAVAKPIRRSLRIPGTMEGKSLKFQSKFRSMKKNKCEIDIPQNRLRKHEFLHAFNYMLGCPHDLGPCV